MSRHCLVASSLLLLLGLGLGAGGCALEPQDALCTEVEETTTILFPADYSNSLDIFIPLQCLDSAPTVDASGRADCFVISARRAIDPSTCDAGEGLVAVSPEHQYAVDRLMAGPEAKANFWNTACELKQIVPTSVGGQACRNGSDLYGKEGEGLLGFCYLDESATGPNSDPYLLQGCPGEERRAIRFLGSAASALTIENKSLTVVCSHQECPAQ